jgi:hypothetical protein
MFRAAVFFLNVMKNFTPPFLTEIDVEIRQTLSFNV